MTDALRDYVANLDGSVRERVLAIMYQKHKSTDEAINAIILAFLEAAVESGEAKLGIGWVERGGREPWTAHEIKRPTATDEFSSLILRLDGSNTDD